MTHEELAEQLVKVMDSLDRLIKAWLNRKKPRQTGPAKGQTYWFALNGCSRFYEYHADHFDLAVSNHAGMYPEERFAEAEIRAIKLIAAFNKRRRELNGGRELGDRSYYVAYWDIPGLVNWELTSSKCMPQESPIRLVCSNAPQIAKYLCVNLRTS